MAFVNLKDIKAQEWVLNIDLISHVLPSDEGGWEAGGVVYLKQTIAGNRNLINLSGVEIQNLFKKILD